MSYQALPDSTNEEHLLTEDLPIYNGQAQVPGKRGVGKGQSATSTTTTTTTGRSKARHGFNYIHISDVGDILGTNYDINTDKAPAYGRFDSQEEQEQAPNVYLSADNIDAEIRLSGSKKAKIEIKGKADAGYGRTMLRITYAQSGGSDIPTPFSLNFSAINRASCLISLPDQYSGAITGACTLSGRLRDEAVCLVADATKSRWTVRQEEESIHPRQSTTSGSTYPPIVENAAVDEVADEEEASDHSSVSFSVIELTLANSHDNKGKRQRQRRYVVNSSDYGIGLKSLRDVEMESRTWVRKAMSIYGASLLAMTIAIQILATWAEGGMGPRIGFPLFFIAMTSFVPILILAERWTELTYKVPVTVPSV